MAKINFTKEHFDKMCYFATTMLLENGTITTKMGQTLNVVELLHTTTINTLNAIRLGLVKRIENLENQDEWVASAQSQLELDKAKAQKEFINLIIGYKRYRLEVEETAKKKMSLMAKIAKMKEEAKTPEDRLKEAEAELSALDSTETFS